MVGRATCHELSISQCLGETVMQAVLYVDHIDITLPQIAVQISLSTTQH